MSTDYAQIAAGQIDDGTPVPELIARYRRGPALLDGAIEGLTQEQLLAHPIPGKMSVQEVVCHVTDCDQFLADRMKRIAAMERPLLVGADGWLYPAALGYAQRDLALDLALLAATRGQMAADLDRLPDDSWARVGIHTETGLVTLRQMLLHTIRHIEHHVTTIEEKRVALGV